VTVPTSHLALLRSIPCQCQGWKRRCFTFSNFCRSKFINQVH